MKTFVLIFVALLAFTAAERVSEEFKPKNIAIQGRSLSSSGKESLENFLSKFPCGWPDAGIPPLAPYTKEEIVFELKKAFAEIFAKIEHFRIDGLDIVLINKLKINYTFKQKVQFNLVFPKIVISGRLVSGALIDFLDDYGIKIQYTGNGDVELILEDIIFQGQFKYKMPFIFGSIKIYKFNGSITLGNAVARINGIVGEGKLKQLLDEQIEDIIMKAVNGNQDKISGKLENELVPYLNAKLKGKKIWSILKSAFGKKGKICYPPADPWARN